MGTDASIGSLPATNGTVSESQPDVPTIEAETEPVSIALENDSTGTFC